MGFPILEGFCSLGGESPCPFSSLLAVNFIQLAEVLPFEHTGAGESRAHDGDQRGRVWRGKHTSLGDKVIFRPRPFLLYSWLFPHIFLVLREYFWVGGKMFLFIFISERWMVHVCLFFLIWVSPASMGVVMRGARNSKMETISCSE
jgi:hypothetical protein